MGERRTRDRHPKLVGVGPVSLDTLAHLMHLGEEDLLGRPMAPQPLRDPTLERPQGPPFYLVRICG
jgi:hypothetical protein